MSVHFLRIIVLVLFLFQGKAYCDWNSDFINNSLLLIDSFTDFDNQYFSTIQRFHESGKSIPVSEEIKNSTSKDKKNYIQDGYFFKQRPNNNINELYVWELSIILSLNEYVTPSVPFEIFDKKIIIQQFEKLTHAKWIEIPSRSVIKSVSLENYYRAHVLAFILGMNDLSGMNIGINPRGLIRFFDNENAFAMITPPKKNERSFDIPFVSVAFDWPQYRKVIDHELSEKLKSFVLSLGDRKNDIFVYAKVRNFPEDKILDIFERIDFLNTFDFSEGTAFLDFVSFLYPHLSQGLDELNQIVGGILHKKVDHGISLFFAARMLRYWSLSDRDKALLASWVEQYVL